MKRIMNTSTYTQQKHAQQGFTLIELMIVIAIIGILAIIAVPQYQTYTKKARFTEVISATSPYKLAVEQCYVEQGALTNCTSGSNGVPAAATTSSYVSAVSVTAGVITATGTTSVDGATFILTPTAPAASTASATLTWAKSGTCSSLGLC